VHRNFAQVAILDGGLAKDHGRFVMEREAVLTFANKVLTKDVDVVLEATGNTAIIVRLLTPFVRRVVIANPLQVRAIAWAKVKTDKIDARPSLVSPGRSSCPRFGCLLRTSNCNGGSWPSGRSWLAR
jgi:hypothetical protein